MVLLLAHAHYAYAQPGSLDATFTQTGTGLNNSVRSLVVQADGKIIVGGDFTTYNGTTRNRIARLNADGSLDGGFVPPGATLNELVLDLAVQSDGKIVLGGNFNAFGRERIARLNTDGSLDATFTQTGSGLNNQTNALAVQSDGKIVVGGLITAYNGTARGRVARLNADGSLDATFVPTGTGLNNDVADIVVQSDGKILVGGDFTAYNGTTRNYIVRLNADGSLDASFAPTGTGLNNVVRALVVQPDGKILVGGGFTDYNGTTRNRVTRLNADGTLDASFAPTGTGLNSTVLALSVQADGKILVGGAFTDYNGTTRNRVTRLNADGTLDASFAPTGTGLNNTVVALSVQADGKILVGGGFTDYNGTTRIRAARLNITPPTAAYTGITFAEAGANNGTITVTQDVSLTDDTWLPAGLFTGGGTHYTATGVPGGLAIAINRISATVARISFTGTAAAHANANDATVTLNFTNAALTGNNAAGVTGLNPASLTLDFNDPAPTAAYASTTFNEAGLNNGTIFVTRDVTLTGDTWLPAGIFTGGGTHYTATGVPAGLAIGINRISATVARISFTGTAAAHQNVDDATVTLNFTNAALTGNNAAGVTGLNPASLTLDFINNPSGIYTGTTFAEAGANNGTITVTQDVTLTGDIWVPAGLFTGGGTHYTSAGVPAGLAIAINRISATVARISFTGTAAAHANANDATVTLNFTNAAIGTGTLSAVTGLNNPASLTLDFNDNPTAAYTGTTFAEAGANNGTITVTQDVTLTSDTWVPAGLFTGGGTHYTATGVPGGLAIAINRISATVARISFTGTAAAHANANDATVTLNFTNAALTSGVAAAVTGLNPASLTLDFNNPGPSAAYTGTTFVEAGANNGTITVTQDVTLTSDTWLPAGLFTGGGTHYTATGVPAGLAIAINRISATVARISFTGTAAAHANADDATVTLNFTNAALTGNNAAAVGGLNPASLTLDFADPAPAAPTLFSAATPPAGTVGTAYSYTFVANGTPAPTYTLFSGTLPTGLSLSGAGVLSGTPTVAGPFGPFVVRASNGSGNLNTAGISITINPAVVPPPPPPPPVLTAPSISGGTFSGSVGLPFGANLNAGGNPAPSVSVSAGALPPGVSLAGSGLSGIPTQQGTYTFTVRATNSEGSATANITVNVGPAVPLITSVSPQSGTFGSTVTISGFNLAGTNAVSIGGVPAQSFTMEGGTVIAVVGAGGTGAVSVSTPLGGTSGGSFTFEVPEPPVLTSLVLPTIPTGDENASMFIAGRNIPVYATVTITPIANNGRVLGENIPLQIIATSSTGATVLVPVFARLSGTKQLSVRVADRTVLATFAVVQTAPPLARELTVTSTTASGEAFTTFVNGSGFFRNGFARVFVNDDESLYSNVVDANQVRVHIPATLNVRNGSVNIRIQNFDGQQTEATVRIIGRNAPYISTVTPRWVNGNLTFVVRGVAFSPRITAVLGRRQLTVLPGGTDIEFAVAVPADYPVPSFGTALLMVENPDGQRYGFLIGAVQFERPSAFLANDKNTSELASSANTRSQARTSSGALLGQMSISPNPASETLMLETPAFTGVGRLSILNARGEEILSGVVTGGERTQVDVRSLVSGAYFVRITGNGVQAVARVNILK